MSLAKRSMTARLLPRLAFLATSFLLALVVLAPTQALAHAGHDHGIIDTSSKPTPVRSIVPTAEPSNKNSSHRLPTVVAVDIEQSSASEATSGMAANKLKNCSGG